MHRIYFGVDRTSIRAGECVETFHWKVEAVKEVHFYRDGERWQDHGVTGEERRQECPPANSTYNLRVVKRDGIGRDAPDRYPGPGRLGAAQHPALWPDAVGPNLTPANAWTSSGRLPATPARCASCTTGGFCGNPHPCKANCGTAPTCWAR